MNAPAVPGPSVPGTISEAEFSMGLKCPFRCVLPGAPGTLPATGPRDTMIIKICGFKTIPEAVAAAEAGADMVGLNFYPPSPRCIDTETARRICEALPPRTVKVGLFVNETIERIQETAAFCGLDAVQLYGDFPADRLPDLAPLKVIRAFGVSKEDDLERLEGVTADFFLLDTAIEGMHGGTGKSFDWCLAAKARRYGRIILAGGLRPDNVGEAIRQARPDGVDVASGVESSPGVKDISLIRQFIQAVRASVPARP